MFGRKLVVWTVGVAVLGLVAGGSTVGAVQPECQVVNLPPKRGLYTSSNYADPLGMAIAEAAPGDTLQVIGVCRGSHQITKNLTIQGRSSAQHDDTIVGDLAGNGVLHIPTTVSGVHLTVSDLTITGGRTGVSAYYQNVVMLRNVNVTGTAGTGIGNFQSSTFVIEDSLVTDNHNTTSGGGGIWNSLGTMSIRNATISGNSATVGGGIVNRGHLTITDSVVAGNTSADRGGGIYMISGDVTLNNSSVADNVASGSGGGVWNTLSGRVSLNNSVVRGNVTADLGGGIFNRGGVTLTDSIVTANTAASGGGIYNDGGGSAVLNGTSSVFGNTPDDVAP